MHAASDSPAPAAAAPPTDRDAAAAVDHPESVLLPNRLDHRSLVLLRLAAAGLTTAVLLHAAWTLAAGGLATRPLVDTVAAEALIAVGLGASAAVLVGWSTRGAALVAWGCLVVLPVVLALPWDGAARALPLLLLWCVLLPVGSAFSVDRAVAWRPPPLYGFAGRARPLFLIQLALVLLAPLWRNLVMGDWALPHPWSTLAMLTHAVAWAPPIVGMVLDAITLAGFALVLAPWSAARTAGVAAMVAVHVLVGVGVTGSLLPVVLAALWLPLLPPEAWELVLRPPGASTRAVTIWHGGTHPPLAHRLIHTFLLHSDTPIRSTREDMEIDVFRRQRRSWVVTDEEGYRHLRFRAFVTVLRASPIAWPLGVALHVGVIEAVGDWLYDLWHRLSPIKGPVARWLERRRPGLTPAPRSGAAVAGIVAALMLAGQAWVLFVSPVAATGSGAERGASLLGHVLGAPPLAELPAAAAEPVELDATAVR